MQKCVEVYIKFRVYLRIVKHNIVNKNVQKSSSKRGIAEDLLHAHMYSVYHTTRDYSQHGDV